MIFSRKYLRILDMASSIATVFSPLMHTKIVDSGCIMVFNPCGGNVFAVQPYSKQMLGKQFRSGYCQCNKLKDFMGVFCNAATIVANASCTPRTSIREAPPMLILKKPGTSGVHFNVVAFRSGPEWTSLCCCS